MAKRPTRDWYEKREWFLDEWRTHVVPLTQHALAGEKYAVDFSLMAVRTGALLNGGALVALPALGAFFHLSVTATSGAIVYAAIAFIVGLICSWLAMAAGYFTNGNHARSLFAARDREAIALHLAFEKVSSEESAHPVLDKTDAPSDEENGWKSKSDGWMKAGVFLWAGSLVAFVFGVYFSGLAVTEATKAEAAKKPPVLQQPTSGNPESPASCSGV